MLKESLLWARTISSDGKIVKQETFLGATLAFIVFAAGLTAIFYIAVHYGIL